MAKHKSPQGEMRDVRGVKGARLSVIPENEGAGDNPTPQAPAKDAPKPEPAPAPQPTAPKPVRLNIQAEFGGFHETAPTLEEAQARAEEIIACGAWQKVGSQLILHGPATIHRVVVSP